MLTSRITLIGLILFVTSCSYEQEQAKFRDDLQNTINSINESENLKRDELSELKNQIEIEIKKDPVTAILWLDSVLSKRTDLVLYHTDLLLHSSDILFDINEYQLSLSQSIKSNKLNTSPKGLSYEARSYIKLNNFLMAESTLIKASNINYDYNWVLGNFYEIIGDSSRAISSYYFLYSQNNVVYDYCKDRIDSLRSGSSLFNELDFDH